MDTEYKLSDAKRAEEIEVCKKIADKVLKEIADPSIWKDEKGMGDISVKKTKYEGTSLDTVLGTIVIDVPFEQCLELSKDTFVEIPKGTPKEEAQGFIFRHLIVNEPDVVVHQNVVDSGSVVVKNRESLCFLYRMRKDENTFVVINTTDGMENEGSEISGTVRMRVHEHVTVWTKLGEDKTQLQLLIHSDPMGKVPTSIYNSVLKKQLKFCEHVKEVVEKKYSGMRAKQNWR